MPVLPGGARKSEFSAYINAKQTCNMSYEPEFCELSEYVQGQKVRPLTMSTDLSK